MYLLRCHLARCEHWLEDHHYLWIISSSLLDTVATSVDNSYCTAGDGACDGGGGGMPSATITTTGVDDIEAAAVAAAAFIFLQWYGVVRRPLRAATMWFGRNSLLPCWRFHSGGGRATWAANPSSRQYGVGMAAMVGLGIVAEWPLHPRGRGQP